MTAGRKGALVATIIVVAVIANAWPRWVHDVMWFGRKAYYLGDALSIVLFVLAGRIASKDSKIMKIFFELALILALSNFSDELVGDPINFGNNEKVFGIVTAVWAIIRVIRCLKQPPMERQ